MQITYELRKVPLEVNLIQSHTSWEENLEELENHITEQQSELQEITSICAQFGCYLNENALAPFNDAIDEHLNLLLRQEQGQPFQDPKAIANLEGLRDKYRLEKETILNAHKSSSDVESISQPKDVEKLQQRLFGLKHNGACLKKIYEEISRTKHNRFYQAKSTQIRSLTDNMCMKVKKLWASFQ